MKLTKCRSNEVTKWRGAHVIATASEQNHDYLRRLGADEVLDYRSVHFEDVARDMDVVFDTIGGDIQVRSWQMLKKGSIDLLWRLSCRWLKRDMARYLVKRAMCWGRSC